jgi:DNA invertase Pin-like site-specific DNA recombinase
MANEFFLYARKSTDTEEKQVLSIEAQLLELRQFAAKERLKIKQEFVEAMTAKPPGRPHLQ